jgi:hypothetical protein
MATKTLTRADLDQLEALSQHILACDAEAHFISRCASCRDAWHVFSAALALLLRDAETLAQIRALHEKYDLEHFGYEADRLIRATTSSGHMTTKQKGEQ